MSESAALILLTGETWTAEGLGRCVAAVEDLYTSFLALQVIRERLSTEGDGPWHGYDLPTYVARSFPRGPTEGDLPFSSAEFPVRTFVYDRGPLGLPEVQYYDFIRQSVYAWRPEAKLSISSIYMGSDGHISVIGVGDAIREVRELIKDLSFRNRQERELGELEIARRKLDLQQSGMSPVALDAVAVQVGRSARPIRDMSRMGLLRPPRTIVDVLAEFKAAVHFVSAGHYNPDLAEAVSLLQGVVDEAGTSERSPFDTYRHVQDVVYHAKQIVLRLRENGVVTSSQYELLADILDRFAKAEQQERNTGV